MGIVGAAITTLLSEILVVVLAFYFSRKKLKLSIAKRNLLLTFMGTMLITIICIVTKYLIESYFIQLLVAIPIAAIIYAFVHIAFKNDLYYNTAVAVLDKVRGTSKPVCHRQALKIFLAREIFATGQFLSSLDSVRFFLNFYHDTPNIPERWLRVFRKGGSLAPDWSLKVPRNNHYFCE